jgi:peptidoglycan hydrolase-like protein with peptidoglycan-binding domain
VAVDGIYGLSTERAVREFQRIFDLEPDGIVGKATWYAISRIYVAVKRLAELTSEGERPNYAIQEYPGYVLRTGSQGNEVLEVQLYLATIALYNNMVRGVEIDGVYGAATRDAVYSFQLAYGLTPDGRVGPLTWRALVDVYNGIKNNVNVPNVGSSLGTVPYPEEELSRGDSGSNVYYVQRLVNALSSVYSELPELSLDGIYGRETERAVRAFQRIVGLNETGVVDRDTWNLLNSTYRQPRSDSVQTFASLTPENSGEREKMSIPTFERPLRVGMTGEDVMRLKRWLFDMGLIEENALANNVFGMATRRAVERAQRLLGLEPTGRVDEKTHNAVFSAVL